MAQLVDSGERKTFETGGMREIVAGKGRCDLLPLGVIAHIFVDADPILVNIHNYVRTGDDRELFYAIRTFIQNHSWDINTAMLELAIHYADGAEKYADRNWEKGLPLHSFIDSGVRHYLKFKRGDTDEPHDRAFLWNMVGAIWTQETYPTNEKLMDLPFAASIEKPAKPLPGSPIYGLSAMTRNGKVEVEP